ncbi:MAG: hypothetical protein IIA03_14040 [Proteobacteria bacterium]|nr:hypothetical protein [Pseudomonadota bacterium]
MTAPRSANRPWRLPAIAFWATALLVLLPPLAVMAYAFSERWDRGLLPEGATLHWLAGLAADALGLRFAIGLVGAIVFASGIWVALGTGARRTERSHKQALIA